MNRIIWAVVAIMVTGVAGSVRAEGIKEGKWSFTMTTKMDGQENPMAEMEAAMANMSEEEKAMMQQMMGGMNIQMGAQGMAINSSHCVTNDNPVPEMEELEGCETTHSIDGNVVKFESTCPDSHSLGEMTYAEETVEGLITSTKTENGEEMGITMEIAGKYEGPCE